MQGGRVGRRLGCVPGGARLLAMAGRWQAPEKALPREVVGRRKTGFGIPVANWMGAGRAGAAGAGSRGWEREVSRAYAGPLHVGSLA